MLRFLSLYILLVSAFCTAHVHAAMEVEVNFDSAMEGWSHDGQDYRAIYSGGVDDSNAIQLLPTAEKTRLQSIRRASRFLVGSGIK